MGLETGTYISDLNPNNPVDATDSVSQGDDHIRVIKSTILATFPNIDGAVNFTPAEGNYLVGVTGTTGTGDLVLSASPTFTGTINAAAITASGAVTAGSFSGSIPANQIDSGTFFDARISESNVTQHEGALTITESQISDLGSYLTTSGDVATNLSIGNADTTLTRDSAGKIAVEGRAMFAHNDGNFVSARVHVGTAEPTGGEGSNGDIFLVY